MLKKITLILFIILIGCQSYEDRFFIQEYDEDSADIAYSEVKHHRINGVKQRVKQLDFDSRDVLRKEIFFGEEFINKIRFYDCLLYTSPSPRDRTRSRMPSSA